jgi:alpha-1,3-mannosyltransferase
METVKDLATNSEHMRWMYPLLLVADAALCTVIIEKVPCKPSRLDKAITRPLTNYLDTEIDWTTYMEHIAIYNKGERDYLNIEGSTGPLVYPGAHVLIYRVLYWITNQGKNIQLAQYIFGLLYLSTLAIVIQCYRKAKVRYP